MQCLLDVRGRKGILGLLMRRNAITKLLVVASLLTAMGTDALAQTRLTVRAEAVVNVAERMASRMASRFSRAFTRKTQQPALPLHVSRPAPTLAVRSTVLYRTPAYIFRQSEHLLYLPPPVLG